MNEPVPGRIWEMWWEEKWVPVHCMDTTTIVLRNGRGIAWRAHRNGDYLPDSRIKLRYTVPYRGENMPWRRGEFDLLVQDMGLPQLMGEIRNAQTVARLNRG